MSIAKRGPIAAYGEALFPGDRRAAPEQRQRRLRIAYLCDRDPNDPGLYSGGNKRIRDALQKHVGEVVLLPQDWGALDWLRHAVEALPEALSIRLRWRLHLMLAPLLSRSVNRELERRPPDVIFGAYALHALAGVQAPRGTLTVFTSDATPTTYRESEVGAAFGSYVSASRLLDPAITRAERQALERADLLLWPTEWLDDAAQAAYGLPAARSRVIPWGANVPRPATPGEPAAIGPAAPLRLLVIGRDWSAKGGPLAVAVLHHLRESGIDARLTVIGCTPPEADLSQHVTVHPELDKAVPEELGTFTEAIRAAHFLVMPSFESYGFAFCEAAAHGLPALCLRVGGVPVRDGINGHALPPGATAEAFAEIIAGYLEDPASYAALRASSRREYEERLNWDAWGRAVAQELERALLDRRGAVSAQ